MDLKINAMNIDERYIRKDGVEITITERSGGTMKESNRSRQKEGVVEEKDGEFEWSRSHEMQKEEGVVGEKDGEFEWSRNREI
ncbi:hypothetical protein L2E82_15536 [Cichorium intybus]|uniref:Uncharacterized protein n=1 Tax=Cichorium intybus TaxID=13427 RepID=A0ACB9F3L3_CICIN|nr:hypothetical protein L2E82_15536 [Cichorium intybus]